MRQDKGAGQAQQKLGRPTSRKTCARHFPAEYAEKLEEMKAMQSRAWKYGLHSQSTLRAPPAPESEREGVQHMDGLKGRPPKKKNVYFRALPESGGGEAPARIFWPFFHKVIGPEISLFLLKSHNICVFFGHFYHQFHQYYHHHHHNYNFNHHHHHLYFFVSYAQYVVFDVRKKRTKLPELRGGGGES